MSVAVDMSFVFDTRDWLSLTLIKIICDVFGDSSVFVTFLEGVHVEVRYFFEGVLQPKDRLSEDNVSKYTETFNMASKGSDTIPTDDTFKELVRACDCSPSEAQFKGVISDIGDDSDIDGFLNACALLKEDPEEKLAKLKEAFSTFDKNGDLVVSLEEFKTVMCKMGEPEDVQEDAETIFKDNDVDGNGVLLWRDVEEMFVI